MKEKITYQEYTILEGLKAIGDKLAEDQKNLSVSIARVIDEEQDDYGYADWSDDLIYGGRTVKEWLKCIGIDIENE